LAGCQRGTTSPIAAGHPWLIINVREISSRLTDREIEHTQNKKKDKIHAMQYKAKQSQPSKDQKGQRA